MSSGAQEGPPQRGKRKRILKHGKRRIKHHKPSHEVQAVEPQRQRQHWYKPFERQKQFRESPAKYRLFGGAAGPGKTKALLEEAIRIALGNDGCSTLLLRRTYPELESSLIAQFRRDVPRNEYRSFNETKRIVTWHNGSTTRFGYCRNENDVYQYQGAEFLFIGIDELTHFTLKQWQFLTSRNRCPIPGTKPCMAGATNPGNIGHAWVKALWVDKTPPPGFERAEQYDPGDYDFIQAKIEDNPIYANDQSYLKSLAALPERLRKAFLEGDWSVFAGQYFDVFEPWRHTLRAEAMRMQEWWPRWISVDWGFHHPSAVYWHCAVPQDNAFSGARGREIVGRTLHGQPADNFDSAAGMAEERREVRRSARNDGPVHPQGAPKILTYREYVKSGLSPRMLGQAIAEMSGSERISEVVLSPDAFAHRTSEASIAEQLGEVLEQNGLPRPSPANDDRIGGWQLMYQMLEHDEWMIAENCRELIQGLPQLVRDEKRVEDVRKVEGDDAADAARYGIVSGVRYAGLGASASAKATAERLRAGQAPPNKFEACAPRFMPGMPVDVQIERHITAKDPTSRMIHRARLEEEARRQLGPRKPGGRRWKW